MWRNKDICNCDQALALRNACDRLMTMAELLEQTLDYVDRGSPKTGRLDDHTRLTLDCEAALARAEEVATLLAEMDEAEEG